MDHVWVGVINHNHGTDIYVGRTEEAVEQKIYDNFVAVYWSNEIQGRELPTDPREAIAAYFATLEGESYSIDLHPLD